MVASGAASPVDTETECGAGAALADDDTVAGTGNADGEADSVVDELGAASNQNNDTAATAAVGFC